jgi:metacaspase-1
MQPNRRHFLKRIALGAAAINIGAATIAPAAARKDPVAPKGRSLHIGLNSVNPDGYSGWSGRLRGCEYDAKDMAAIAKTQGFDPIVTLTTKEATKSALMDGLAEAASWSKTNPDSLVLVTYSGHGGYIPDPLKIKPSGMSDTWCLYDTEVIDHELYNAWADFAKGTRILVLSDSCHSGTVIRDMIALRNASRGSLEQNVRDFQFGGKTLELGVGFDEWRHAFSDTAGLTLPKENASPSREEPFSSTRDVPLKIQEKILTDHKELGKREEDAANSRKGKIVESSVLLISGCQDDETSGDGPKNGLFTAALKTVWDGGKFPGKNYQEFRNAIAWQLKYENQHPNYYTTGAPNSTFESQRPFTIG